jgi:hypothetical protein
LFEEAEVIFNEEVADKSKHNTNEINEMLNEID